MAGGEPGSEDAQSPGRGALDSVETVPIGGLPIARVGSDGLADAIFRALARGRGGSVVTANIDFVQRAAGSPEMRDLYRRADWIVADGVPLLWAARLRGSPLPERIAGSDLVWRLAERASREGRSLYLLGGEGDAARLACERLATRFPGLEVAGFSSPRVSARPGVDEIERLAARILPTRPDLVLVALGSPKQEWVIAGLRPQLPSAWMLGCGISFSFVAGQVQRAPAWMQRAGLEWIHRLAQEPRRLAGRYLLRNLPFTARLLVESLHSRR